MSHHAEKERLERDAKRVANWKRWGPYLSERQWATVREDYSPDGSCWDFFPHEHARSRAYRWGEDGLLGFTDRECRLCFGLALWNEKDPILKERLFGLTGNEGNHGEDVKELYFYLDATPTYSYCKALYRYPQAEFPYRLLIDENRRRGKEAREFELLDSGVFDENRYFDIVIEYAKESPDDVLIRITATNRGPARATLHILPTLWFRNTWAWGAAHEGLLVPPRLRRDEQGGAILADHETLGTFRLAVGTAPGGMKPPLLFTDNESNVQRLWGAQKGPRFAKDAFHDYVIHGRRDAVNPDGTGTKAAAHHVLSLVPNESGTVCLRLYGEKETLHEPFGGAFDRILTQRLEEANEFYSTIIPDYLTEAERLVVRQAYAGLLWSKQFYHYVVEDWLNGDAVGPRPPPQHSNGRNRDWSHVYSRDVISMPDKWEYPWFAAWDLAFHMLPFASIDAKFAKEQLIMLLREWYMHPNGQIPAYEFAFHDVNPPVHAWAAWRVYKICARRGERDRSFLESVFQKLLLNFTWWVNRKDLQGRSLFSGGFLGLDNIGVLDRSKSLPGGGVLEQADGTAWMAFYCVTMLNMALELAIDGERVHEAYEDMASKFLEHFVQIADAMNTVGGTGLWDEEDGFYYDQLALERGSVRLRSRSMVGLLPLIAVEVLEEGRVRSLPGFSKRLHWFLRHREDLCGQVTHIEESEGRRLLAIPNHRRLERVLRYMLDEKEFLSPHGLRSVSRFHKRHPFELYVSGELHRIEYEPAESRTGLFGGNSNWRGPVWFPVNYLLIEAMERYHHFYGDALLVECPTGSGKLMSLAQVAKELGRRLSSLFLPDSKGRCAMHGDDPRWSNDPCWRGLMQFHEYFDGDTGRGLGASHQTGWTALVIRLVTDGARARAGVGPACPA